LIGQDGDYTKAPGSFIGIAIWELLEVLITGAALWYEGNSRVNKKKQSL
jgi:hypothetical protein